MIGKRRPNIATPRLIRSGRAGNAGVIASFAIAFAGVLVGALSAYFSEQGAAARAARESAPAAGAYEARAGARDFAVRDRLVQAALADAALERLAAPGEGSRDYAERPRIIIVIDDLGLDPAMAERFIALPGPLTLSFLPYAGNVETLADKAGAAGADVMLHLPMEPVGEADPGPYALRLGMTGADFLGNLEWNLSRFDGYVGVNNHMGSRLTADRAAMKTVLGYLKGRGLFFLDSVTTAHTEARSAAAAVGARLVERDVFLDAEPGDPRYVKAQLEIVERIALETGYAVAIGHPYEATLEALGPWLTSAPARGFEITAISSLIERDRRRNAAPVLAETPALRL